MAQQGGGGRGGAGEGGEESLSWAPLPLSTFQERATPGRATASVNVLSLGFAATAILLSLFLLMALFERFLRPTPPSLPSPHSLSLPSSSHSPSSSKHHFQAASVCDSFVGVSVLMPGHTMPTFIAKPAPPLPCHLSEAASWPAAACSLHISRDSSFSKETLNEQGVMPNASIRSQH